MGKLKKQKRKAKTTTKAVLGVAWYRRDQWDRLLEISSDRAELEDTYDEWKAVAEENLRNLTPCEDQHLAKLKAIRKKRKKVAKSKALVISKYIKIFHQA